MVVGGKCEGCEAIFESPVPFAQLNEVDTLPDFLLAGPKLVVSGIIYQPDNKTPAAGVVMYFYHTDQKGIYPAGNEKGWGKRHGYLRGWVKTNKDGFYQFYTLKPASYPEGRNPAHIHATIKEPGKTAYWIDDFLFADDPFLKQADKNSETPRGGNGLLKPTLKNDVLYASRNIVLGENIPGYPVAAQKKIISGLPLGANCPAFDPLHLSGIDKGKHTCPMCKYGYGQGVMVWFNHAGLEQLSGFVKRMEHEMDVRGESNFRVFLIYMNPFYKENDAEGLHILQEKIRKWCEEQSLKKVAMLWVPSPVDEETCALFRINPEAKNTVFVYKKRRVAKKWVNIAYDNESAQSILSSF